MKTNQKWSRILLIVGLVFTIGGALDPLEGSIVIAAGVAILALGGLLGKSKYRALLAWSFVLTAVGVGAMWWHTFLGGFGGTTGRSNWWWLSLLPYPVGWVMALVGGFRSLRRPPGDSKPSGQVEQEAVDGR